MPSRAKAVTFVALAAAGAASVAVMLLVSVTRWFLPGVVELSTAFALAGTFGLLMLTGRNGRAAFYLWVGGISGRTMKYTAAGVAVLVLSAVIAVPVENFPWPVTLLAGVLVILIGAADPGTKQGVSGNNGQRPDDPSPIAPFPSNDGQAAALRPGALRLNVAYAPHLAHRTLRHTPAPRRYARPDRRLHPVRRKVPVSSHK